MPGARMGSEDLQDREALGSKATKPWTIDGPPARDAAGADLPVRLLTV